MPAPTTIDDILALVRKSGLVDEKKLDTYLENLHHSGPLPTEPNRFAGVLIRDAILTQFQAEQLLLGKWRRFHIGKYKVLERIGSGGMGSVYLCEHRLMRRRVAVKVLPTAKSDDSSARERFDREAKAIAALDHPNIVRAYDIDQDENLHFLVMEYVDGANLQEIIKRSGGPLEIQRAAHYIAQAALGLQHAHDRAGLVHRDIKPGNILVDRNGGVKVLDMGLARFFHDEEDLLTQKYDENVLGTADYLAPEQALDSHNVDIRADLYSLGATLYFCLTGRAPFSEGSVAQKLIWHQTRQPKPIRALRPEVPEEMAAVVDKLMAKDPAQRYQTPAEVAEALSPWTRTPIPPPPDVEMLKLSPAAMGTVLGESGAAAFTPQPAVGPSSRARKVWQVSPSTQPRNTAPTTPAPPPAPKPPSPRPEPPAAKSSPAQAAALVTAPQPAATPAPEAEPVSWEDLTADTQDALVQADTVPNKSRPRQPGLTATRAEAMPPGKTSWRPYLPWIAGGAVAVLVLAAVLWYLLSGDKSVKQPPAPTGPQVLRVQKGASGQPHTFESLREALTKAKPQDRIKVLDEIIEEQILLTDPRPAADLVIESGLVGKPVQWRAPTQLRDGEPLLKVNQLEGLRLQGFILDGQGRIKDLITVTGVCPSFTLEDVQLRGFTGRGLTLVNCEGCADKPVRFTRLHVQRAKPSETGFFFDAHPKVREGVNQHIILTDCKVEGGDSNLAVVITSPEVLRNVEFVNSPKPQQAKPPSKK